MLAMASARSEPIARPDPVSPPLSAASVDRWGVGVAGTAAAVDGCCAGAAGAAGVEAAGWAGVAGGAAAAGFSLGCRIRSQYTHCHVEYELWK